MAMWPSVVPAQSRGPPVFEDELANDSLLNCSNEYCVSDADYIAMIEDHIFPRWYEWVLIAMHCVVFVVGLVGNALVCVAVYRNHTMRTVTNFFIVNLAVADFMVILFCLPPSVVWDVTETWFMGTALCKVVLYFQITVLYAEVGSCINLQADLARMCSWNVYNKIIKTVSVTVSVLTLTFISVDRWYAICFPLRFRSTTSRAKVAILIIWLLALAFDVPELVVLRAQRKPGLPRNSPLLTQCVPSWTSTSDMTFHVIKTTVLYTLPLLFMAIAYCQIARVLWRSENIPGHDEAASTASMSRHPHNDLESSSRRGTYCATANTTTDSQLRSRRNAAKMLVAVVLMFAICFFPVHLLNILRYTMTIPQTDVTTAVSSLSHWLCYANSAINPVIYNFMSGKFRKEFRRTFGFWWCYRETHSRRHTLTPHSSTYVCNFTATRNSTYMTRAEMVPLRTIMTCCPD